MVSRIMWLQGHQPSESGMVIRARAKQWLWVAQSSLPSWRDTDRLQTRNNPLRGLATTTRNIWKKELLVGGDANYCPTLKDYSVAHDGILGLGSLRQSHLEGYLSNTESAEEHHIKVTCRMVVLRAFMLGWC